MELADPSRPAGGLTDLPGTLPLRDMGEPRENSRNAAVGGLAERLGGRGEVGLVGALAGQRASGLPGEAAPRCRRVGLVLRPNATLLSTSSRWWRRAAALSRGGGEWKRGEVDL